MTDWKRALQRAIEGVDNLSDEVRLRLSRLARAGDPLKIYSYLGFGTPHRLLLSGRVLQDERNRPPGRSDTRWRNLVELYRFLESDEVPGARVRARFLGAGHEAVADREGYFGLEIEPAEPLASHGWHDVPLELLHPAPPLGGPVHATARVLVPPPTAQFGVISDIDDTVLWSNVAHKLEMLLMVALSNAHTRKPFKGVAAFYRALQRGTTGAEGNPVFYVSSSPWNLYAPLVEFLTVQDIPLGPLLLKDFGDHTLFSMHDHHSHKLASIKRIVDTYPHLEFVLVGDSGEQDPEIYGEIVRSYPQRIRAVYIRSVDPDPARIDALDRLVAEIGKTGAQLIVAADSEFAAVHAAAEGLISAADLACIRSDKKEDAQAAEPQSLGQD